jgi:hypothetical protein
LNILAIAPGVTLDQPIEIVHLGSGAGAGSFHTRSLVTLGAGSRASVLEVYAGPETGERRYWRNDVVAVRLAEDAELTRTIIVEESAHAVHLGQLDATLGIAARLTGFALLIGGHTVRHEANVRMAGENARFRVRVDSYDRLGSLLGLGLRRLLGFGLRLGTEVDLAAQAEQVLSELEAVLLAGGGPELLGGALRPLAARREEHHVH